MDSARAPQTTTYAAKAVALDRVPRDAIVDNVLHITDPADEEDVHVSGHGDPRSDERVRALFECKVCDLVRPDEARVHEVRAVRIQLGDEHERVLFIVQEAAPRKLETVRRPRNIRAPLRVDGDAECFLIE